MEEFQIHLNKWNEYLNINISKYFKVSGIEMLSGVFDNNKAILRVSTTKEEIDEFVIRWERFIDVVYD